MKQGYVTEIITTVPYTIPDRYKIEKRIGYGAQGHVVAAMDQVRGERVAIKKFIKGFSTDPKTTVENWRIQLQLLHI